MEAFDNTESMALNGANVMSEEDMRRALRKILQEDGLIQTKVHKTEEKEEARNQNTNLEGVLENIHQELAELRQTRQ